MSTATGAMKQRNRRRAKTYFGVCAFLHSVYTMKRDIISVIDMESDLTKLIDRAIKIKRDLKRDKQHKS